MADGRWHRFSDVPSFYCARRPRFPANSFRERRARTRPSWSHRGVERETKGNGVMASPSQDYTIESGIQQSAEDEQMRVGKSTFDSSEHEILNGKSSFFRLAKSIVSSPSWKRRTSSSRSRDFECLDCCLIAPLNVHGRCQRCGSNGVIQIDAFAMRAKRAA